jgi:uncharacterized membrane protein
MRIASVGHALFAAAMIAVGIWGLVKGEFAPIWDGVPKDFPAQTAPAYLCAAVALAGGLGLLFKRTAAPASRLLFGYLVLWILLIKLPIILRHLLVEVAYQTTGETAVSVAAAWILYAGFATDWDRKHMGFATGDRGVRNGRVLYAGALIAFGLSHFAYLENTASLVPAWLPGHVGWSYFTGAAYLAAAAALLTGVLPRLAAALTTLQMALFGLLVWVPRVLTDHVNTFQWGEFAVTCVLTAGAWVVVDSYRATPWLATGWRKA